MSHIVSVDPGNDGCGVAVWSLDGKLMRASYARPSTARSPWPATRWLDVAYAVAAFAGLGMPDEVAIEVPQVYDRDPVPPNDLVTLAACAGVVLGALRPTKAFRYLPREWKGQLPKDVSERRSRDHLDERERSVVTLPAPSLAHNVWDAVGIGLHHPQQTGRRLR